MHFVFDIHKVDTSSFCPWSLLAMIGMLASGNPQEGPGGLPVEPRAGRSLWSSGRENPEGS